MSKNSPKTYLIMIYFEVTGIGNWHLTWSLYLRTKCSHTTLFKKLVILEGESAKSIQIFNLILFRIENGELEWWVFLLCKHALSRVSEKLKI